MREAATGTAGTVGLLADVHAIAEQGQAQARQALEIAGIDGLTEIFAIHLAETEDQERRLRERLEVYGAGPAIRKDSERAGGIGLAAFAATQPDTPGKLVAHAFGFEHLAIATCELLEQRAGQAGDDTTVAMAAEIAEEGRRMVDWLRKSFDTAVEVTLDGEDPDTQLNRFLSTAQATEREGLHLLETTLKVVSNPKLKELFSAHLGESEEHEAMIRERLEARHGGPTTAKDAALRIADLQIGAFFAAQPDTEARIGAFALAFEQLEIASYEMLALAARRAGDAKVLGAAERILAEERATADRLGSLSRPG